MDQKHVGCLLWLLIALLLFSPCLKHLETEVPLNDGKSPMPYQSLKSHFCPLQTPLSIFKSKFNSSQAIIKGPSQAASTGVFPLTLGDLLYGESRACRQPQPGHLLSFPFENLKNILLLDFCGVFFLFSTDA